MNKINYIVDRIKEEIPIEILNLTFKKPQMYNVLPIPVEQTIIEKIVVGVIQRDINMIGGIQTLIDISTCPITIVENGTIIDVGFKVTNGRTILSVLDMAYAYVGNISGPPTIASAIAPSPSLTETRIETIGINVIFIEGFISTQYLILRCILYRDSDFKDIPVSGLRLLSDLAIAATKRHIYKEIRIKLIGNGTIVQGVDMGLVKEIVDEYADAKDIYADMLTTRWEKMSLLLDPMSKQRLIRMTTPP